MGTSFYRKPDLQFDQLRMSMNASLRKVSFGFWTVNIPLQFILGVEVQGKMVPQQQWQSGWETCPTPLERHANSTLQCRYPVISQFN